MAMDGTYRTGRLKFTQKISLDGEHVLAISFRQKVTFDIIILHSFNSLDLKNIENDKIQRKLLVAIVPNPSPVFTNPNR